LIFGIASIGGIAGAFVGPFIQKRLSYGQAIISICWLTALIWPLLAIAPNLVVLTLFFMLLVSLVWEATLAVPYNWWNFQRSQMMGIFVGAWSRLPIEEICVWIAVTYATVIVFEVVKVLLASERSVRESLLGVKEGH